MAVAIPSVWAGPRSTTRARFCLPLRQVAEPFDDKGITIERRIAQLDSTPMPQLRSLTVVTHKGYIACTRKYLPNAHGTRVSVDCEE
jgi:hypothetical protein